MLAIKQYALHLAENGRVVSGGVSVFDLSTGAGDTLADLIGKNAAVTYLSDYLCSLGVSAVVVEGHYVDRHYLGDYVHYYARSFAAPSTICKRFHFFRDIDTAELDRQLSLACGCRAIASSAQDYLGNRYLGFVVKRPLEGAPLGRTVLKTYPDIGRRQYTAVRPYRVNLLNIELTIDGLAFQQQDRGAAVCASTALWSALQKVAYIAGYRTPTPCDVTQAANSPYPAAAGLNMQQMAHALAQLGYSADHFVPGDNHALFRAKIATYLNSQLPVVLLIENQSRCSGHAVTVTGYSEPEMLADVTTPGLVAPFKMRGAGLEVVYVHDDNLGSHAHYELLSSPAMSRHIARTKKKPFPSRPIKTPGCSSPLMLRRGRSNEPPHSYWRPSDWIVTGALVPKPVKLRLPTDSLFENLVWLRQVFEAALPGVALNYSIRFATGIDYRRASAEYSLNDTERRSFFEDVALPRFVGVISIFRGAGLLLDLIVDVSEVQRHQLLPSIVAIVAPGVPRLSSAGLWLRQAAKPLRVPSVICAP